MVKIGAGGANFSSYVNSQWYNDPDYILCRLPLAAARHYIQGFWTLQYKVRCRKIGTKHESLRQTLIR